MRLSAAIPVALLSALAAPGRAPSAALQGPFRDLTVDAALETATRESKPVLVALLSTDCGPCDAYDRFVFADPDVAAWLEGSLVAVRRVDDEAAEARFEASRPPVLVFTDAHGEELDRIGTYLEPAVFLERARALVAGDSPVQDARRAVAAAPEDPAARLALADLLAGQGRRRAALEPYLWVFDHTRGDEGGGEQRLGKLLDTIAALRPLPEADAALRARRDQDAKALLEPPEVGAERVDLELAARELVAIDLALQDARETLRVWDTLRARDDAPREALAILLDDTTQLLLLQDARYDDLLEGLGDPLGFVQARLAEVQEARQRVEAGELKPYQLRPIQSRLIADVERCYRALLGAHRDDEAGIVVDMVLGLEPGVDSYLTLIGSALEVERSEVAQGLVDRGLEAFPGGPERQRLLRLARLRLGKEG